MGQLALVKFDARNCQLPPVINQEAWQEWAEFRQATRKKISEFAAKKQLKMLADYDHKTQQEIIDHSIQNDYQGLFRPKTKRPAQEFSSDWLGPKIIEGQVIG